MTGVRGSRSRDGRPQFAKSRLCIGLAQNGSVTVWGRYMTYALTVTCRLAEPVDWSLAETALMHACEGTAMDALRVLRPDAERVLLIVEADHESALKEVAGPVLRSWAGKIAGVELVETMCGPIKTLRGHGETQPGSGLEAFVAHAVAEGCVWGLYDQTWARSAAADEAECLPFWSSRSEAISCIQGPWQTHAPRAIKVDAFVDSWVPGMVEDGIVVCLDARCPRSGQIIEASRLLDALENAASEVD